MGFKARIVVAVVTVAAAMGTGVAACYESVGVTVHEPGEYKGDKDPLLKKQRDPDQQERLRERFRTVQTDR